MNTQTRILIVEHDTNDIELMQHELKKGGIRYLAEIVQTESEYRNALKNFVPDIILSDYKLPAFHGLVAFEIREKISPLTPIIIVSGTIGEENSIELIRNGLTDFVLKDKLYSLTTKVQRALKEAKANRQKIKLDEELALEHREKAKRLEDLIIINKELTEGKAALKEKEFFLRESQRVGQIGSYNTNFVTGYWQSSETLDSIFGIDNNYVRSIAGWVKIVHPDDQNAMDEYLRLEVIGKQKSFDREYRIVKINDKQTRWVHGLGEVKFDETGNIVDMIGTIQDITDRKNSEEKTGKTTTQLSIAAEIAKLGYWELDLTKGLFTFTDQFYAIFKSTAEKVGGYTMTPDHYSELFVYPDDRAIVGRGDCKSLAIRR